MELWKICRAVNNAVRLDMLRVISQSPCCALNVLQTGDFVRLQKAASSQYLKQLAAAGFLAVERNGRYVVCSCSDAPGTCAGEIYGALKTVFPKSSKTDWTDGVIEKINAFSHYVRIRILNQLCEKGVMGFEQLLKRTDLTAKTLRRQIGVLITAGFVEPDTNSETEAREYRLAEVNDPLSKALLKCLKFDHSLQTVALQN